MQSFKISRHISITQLSQDYDSKVPSKFHKDHFILTDSLKEKDFIINGTIKYFIDQFSEPLSLRKLLKAVKFDLNGETRNITETCTSFFKFLVRKNILVPSNAKEEIIEKPTFLKEKDLLGNLTIEKILSDRGNIEIYLAHGRVRTDKSVIKLLSFLKTENLRVYKEELYELEREYHMMKSVQHLPFMCQAYHFEKHAKYAYINIEYIKGLSILRFLRTRKGLTNADCFEIIAEFLTGFAQMHENGLIHGDIHSSNLLVSNDRRVRILDLGYSRKVEHDENEVLSFGGVVYYMPPERIHVAGTRKYTQDADLYSDVYQIGILMYLVLYKTLPFDGFVWEELSRNIQESTEVYPKMSFLNFPVSKKIIGIIKKCLSKNPLDRYANASEIAKDFKLSSRRITGRKKR